MAFSAFAAGLTRGFIALGILAVLNGCEARDAAPTQTLPEARAGFATRLINGPSRRQRVSVPLPELFRLVKYSSPAGDLSAYVSPSPGDGKKHPAVIWLVGGFSNGLDDVWEPQDPANDQSASSFSKAGLLMMYPSLRGGADNPGAKESFYGEVDDVLSAVKYLEGLDYIDPQRIYLGGHSTGGTLALLAAECGDHFRAVFALGPTHDPVLYGAKYLAFDPGDAKERRLRAPIHWLHGIRNPTFVFEGDEGNIASLRALEKANTNPLVHFFPIAGATHFTGILPISKLIAGKIVADTGAASNIEFTPAEVAKATGK